MEFKLLPDDRVCVYRVAGARGKQPGLFGSVDPPGCAQRGCINGPPQRARAEDLRERLGWLPLETDEDKVWVPLLLH